MSTGIEWTDEVWNPMTGCTKISTGCDHCSAHTVAHRRTRDIYLRQLPVKDTPENRAKFAATIPLGRFSKPSDIAAACVYLASDEADFITGVVLPVDGGRTI